jgi:hypothetical protein
MFCGVTVPGNAASDCSHFQLSSRNSLTYQMVGWLNETWVNLIAICNATKNFATIALAATTPQKFRHCGLQSPKQEYLNASD